MQKKPVYLITNQFFIFANQSILSLEFNWLGKAFVSEIPTIQIPNGSLTNCNVQINKLKKNR